MPSCAHSQANSPAGALRAPRACLVAALALQAWFAHAQPAPAVAAAVCAACHAQDGNSTDPKVPRLAGLHPGYLISQLKAFASGTRHSEVMQPVAGQHAEYTRQQLLAFRSGRRGAYRLMVTVAQRLTEKDIEAVSDLISTLPGKDAK